MKRFLKILSYLVLGLIVFALIFVIFTQTPIFKSWLKNKAIAMLEAETNATYRIEKLRGNFINYIQLEGVEIDLENETILRLDRALIQYDLSPLLFKQIVVTEILLEAPHLIIKKDKTGSFNFARLPKSTPDTTSVEKQGRFDWQVRLPRIQIRAGRAELDVEVPSINVPKRIDDFELTAAVWYSQQHLRFELDALSFNSATPDLELRTSHSSVAFDKTGFLTEELALQTGSSQITSNLEVRDPENPVVDVLFKGQPLSLEEVRRFLPAFNLHGTPRFDFEARGPLSNLDIDFNLVLGEASCNIAGTIQAGNEPYRYDLTGTVNRFDLAELLNDSTYVSDLNLDFRVTGEGIEWGKINSSINMQIDSSRVMGNQIEPTTLSCNVRNDSLDLVLDFFSRGADVKMSGQAIANDNALTYSLNAKVSHLDLSRFLSDSPRSDLNLLVELAGTGAELDSIDADLFVQFLPSSVSQVPIDSARVRFNLNNGVIAVHEFEITSPMASLSAAGEFSIRNQTNLRLDANFSDFSVLSQVTPLDSIAGSGHLNARLLGPIDSLQVDAEFDFAGVRSPDLQVAQFKGTGHGIFATMTTSFDIAGYALQAVAADIDIDSTDFDISFVDSVAAFDIHLQPAGGLFVTTGGKTTFGQNMTAVELTDLQVEFRDESWQAADTARIELAGAQIRVSDFRLTSGGQTLTLDGHLDTETRTDLALSLNGVDVNRYLTYFDEELRVDGVLDLKASLAGELTAPELTLDLGIREGQFYHVTFTEFLTRVEYQRETMRWSTHVSTPETEKLLESSGRLPMRLSLSPFEQEIDARDTLEVKFNSRGIDVSIFEPVVTGLTDIRGLLTADIVLSNTLRDLSGRGTIRIVDGEFRIPELGTKYTAVSVALALEDRSVNIIDLRMRSGGGFVQFLEGALSLSREELSTFSARFRLQNFQLINNDKMRARARGAIELAGNIQAPRVSGNLAVDEAVIHYEKWLGDKTEVLLTSKPFFVITPDTVEFDTAGAIRFQKELHEEERFTESQFYKNLRGQLSVEFLRNSWIRSRDTNIEIAGELSVVKETEDFVLQGNLSTSRGYYNLLGNRFQIEKGNIRFTGDPDMNASVDITAVYRFLDQTPDPRNREFQVLITGHLYEPQFQFLLDGAPANQEDLISILLFGRPASASHYATVTGGARETNEEDSNGLGETARGILTTQTLNLLGRKLGEELSLDVIQIESGKDLRESRVRIGKYLTPEVFVSLSQPFGSEGNQKVELEYAIPHQILFFNLLIQAVVEEQGDSGADLIWKIEW